MKTLLITLAALFLLTACSRKTTDKDARAIEANLGQLSVAALQIMLENGQPEVRFDEIVGEGRYIREVKAVNGESYQSLVFTSKTTSVSVSARDGRKITYRIGP